MKKVEYLIEKFDAIAEKLGKQNVMLITFITVVLIITGLYSTFSLYTSLEGVQIIDGLTTYKFVLDPEMGETSVIIAGNTSKMIDIVVTNKEDIPLKYGLYYNSSNNLSNVSLGYVSNSPYKATDNVEVGGANKVTLKITNNSSGNVTINFGLSYGTPEGGKLNLPSGNNWVGGYFNYLADVEPGSYVSYTGNHGCSGYACKGRNANYVSSSDLGYCSSSSYKFTVNGWRVGYVEDDTAYLVTAGSPECIYADFKLYSEEINNYTGVNSKRMFGTSMWYSTDSNNGTYGYLTYSSGSVTSLSPYSNYESIVGKYVCVDEEIYFHDYSRYGCKLMFKVTGYNLSSGSYFQSFNGILYYTYDRSENASLTFSNKLNSRAIKYCNENYSYRGNCDNTTTWAMGDSDYQKIIGQSLSSCNKSTASLCNNTNDLINNGGYYWFNEIDNYSYINFAWSPSSTFIYSTTIDNKYGLRPVVRMDSSVVVTGGSGTISDPYVISIHEEDKKDKEFGNVANEPVLDEGMIPVSFDSSDDSWKNTSSSNIDYNWYDYENKRWANAVILGPDTIIDKSGNAKHGVVAAAAKWDKEEEVVTTGATGTTDYVSLGLDGYDFGTNFSFVIRVKFNKNFSTSANNWFFANNQSGGWGAYVSTSGYLTFNVQVGSTNYNCVSEVKPVIDTWYTIVGTYDGANMSLYLDGTLIAETANTVVPTVVNFPFMIGGNPNADKVVDTSTDTPVTVSDVLIFTRALTSSEIASDYTGIPEPSDESSLLLKYDFSDPYENLDVNDILWKTGGQGNIAFYTWIPRFKYRVWNINRQAGTEDTYAYPAYTKGIDIMWEDGKASTGNVSCTYDSATTGAAGILNDKCTYLKRDEIVTTSVNSDYQDAWYTHPAFTYNGKQIEGFWIGKFETAGIAAAPKIVPDVTSLRSQVVSTQFTTARKFQNYGLSNKVEARMLNNLEWAAVAYLTHSKYGLCSDSGCRDVYNNNSSSYYTGRSAGVVASNSTAVANGTYDYLGYTVANTAVARDESKVASTTGNVTGVYDMVGGAYDHVMGNMHSTSDALSASSSGTSWNGSTTLDSKYYTSYAYGKVYNTQDAYNRARLGDATAEVTFAVGDDGVWASPESSVRARGYFMSYKDSSNTYPWMNRSGLYNSTFGGIFYFGRSKGGSDDDYSFRSVIS